MAFQTGGARNSIGDWLLNDWLPFAQTHGFVANQAPTPGTPPSNDVWTWQGSVGTPAPPYLYMHAENLNLFVFTGDGSTGTGPAIDTGQEVFDQPGNPSNGIQSGGFTAGGHETVPERNRCIQINKPGGGSITGSFMFSPATDEYLHSVIQLSTREFRHFSVGHIDVDDSTALSEAWFVLGHHLNQAAADIDSPYAISHKHYNNIRVASPVTSATTDDARRYGYLRIPGLPTYDWWFLSAQNANNIGGWTSFSKPVGDVNESAGEVTAGQASILGGGNSFGSRLLFHCELPLMALESPLIPYRVVVNVPIIDGVKGMWGRIGTLPGVFRTSMRGYSPNQQITVAGSNYRVYPLSNDDTASTNVDEEYTGWEGLAYLE